MQGDFITVVKKPYEDWWIGKVGDGPEGMFCILMVDTRPLGEQEMIKCLQYNALSGAV